MYDCLSYFAEKNICFRQFHFQRMRRSHICRSGRNQLRRHWRMSVNRKFANSRVNEVGESLIMCAHSLTHASVSLYYWLNALRWKSSKCREWYWPCKAQVIRNNGQSAEMPLEFQLATAINWPLCSFFLYLAARIALECGEPCLFVYFAIIILLRADESCCWTRRDGTLWSARACMHLTNLIASTALSNEDLVGAFA